MASPSTLSDDLFGDSSTTPNTPAASPPPPPVPVASSSSIPLSLPSFVPRALKKRLPTSKPSLTQSLPRPTTPALVHKREERVIDPREIQRLESILVVIESSFSNHGLSLYRSSGLLDKFKGGTEWIHLSTVLSLPPVRALTGIIGDLKKAVELRTSEIIKVDETGYQIGRKEATDRRSEWEELEKIDPAEWDACSIHIENIPFNPSISCISPSSPTTFSLLSFLSLSLSTPIQRLVLPQLYDPTNPSLEEEEDDEEGENSQSQAFMNSLKVGNEGEGNKAVGLPKGGGGFRGFAFVVLENREEVERVLREWGEGDREEELKVGEEDMEMGESGNEGKGKGKGKEVTCEEKARKGGMKVMRYSRWLELKKEYLSYRKTLRHLLSAQQSGELDQLRNPPATKDAPPHLQQQQQQQQQFASLDPSKRSKRASSPSHDPPSKRPKRASSPSLSTVPRHTRPIRTPSPLPSSEPLDLTSDQALQIQGAYPVGCVLWVRNVHEKSSKTSLKALFGKLLDSLQEGSGLGVEFVDYEKGLETCYIRFSSSSLSTLTHSHLSQTPTYHLTQTSLSPSDSLTKEEREEAQKESRRPIVSEPLDGERERSYWASLPESTRKSARLGAGGEVGLVKMPRGQEEVGGGGAGMGNGGGGGGGKRKKPSKF